MIVRRLWQFTAVVFTGSILIGCINQPTDQQLVRNHWNEAIDALDYTPLLNQSEDVRVGDVLIIRSNAYTALTGARWTSLPVSDLLLEEYNNRGFWPPTPTQYLLIEETEATAIEPEILAEPEIFAGNQPTTRLSAIDLATLSNIVFTEGDVLRLVPSEAAGVLPGLGYDDPKVVRMSIASAEVYTLPLRMLLPLIFEPTSQDGSTYLAVSNGEAQQLALLSPVASTIELAVISEVVYARVIDIVVERSQDSMIDDPLYEDELPFDDSDDLSVSVITPDSSFDDGNSTGNFDGDEDDSHTVVALSDNGHPEAIVLIDAEGNATAVDIDGEELAIDPVLAAYIRAHEINKILIEGDLSDTPAGTVRVLSATDDSITFRRFFRRGIAIAVRGLRLEIDPATREILSAKPLR